MAYGAAETEYMYYEKCNFPWAIKTLCFYKVDEVRFHHHIHLFFCSVAFSCSVYFSDLSFSASLALSLSLSQPIPTSPISLSLFLALLFLHSPLEIMHMTRGHRIIVAPNVGRDIV